MARRVLPALLVFAALLSDASDSHGLALVFLFAGIPAAFMLALDCYGDAIDARCGRARPILATLAVFLLVLSAALRSPAVVGGVPQLAVSALVLCLFLYGGALVGALFSPRPRARVVARPRAVEEQQHEERIAA
jgi:hypothetical protein